VREGLGVDHQGRRAHAPRLGTSDDAGEAAQLVDRALAARPADAP
jgi:hypothetical protein